MLLVSRFICFILIHFIFARLQINLDLTDTAGDTKNALLWQHDCLHVSATIHYPEDPIQIISYCMNEWSRQWNIQENNLNQMLTFAELYDLHITSEQLYLWSAPMDTIEQYQFYLNQRSTSTNLSFMAKQIFYNCTSSRFGPLCQYSFDGYESSDLSLQTIVSDLYGSRYNPTTMTCYMHLQCHRGSSSTCLDWTEICDGRIDCLNDGIDEEHCWQLEINECDDNEYRCDNGQCIPKTFRDDANNVAYDCIDKSDEIRARNERPSRVVTEPIFAEEDVRCIREPTFELQFTTSCVNNRNGLLSEFLFVDEPKMVSSRCWYAFRCNFEIPNSFHPICREICSDRKICQEIINSSCPDLLFIPEIPIFFGHIYFAYSKQAALESFSWTLPPTYICYNEQLCGGFLPNTTLLTFNDSTCRQPKDFPLKFSPGGRGQWFNTYIKPIYQNLSKCNTIIQNSSIVCNSPVMYHCLNSSKCIPYHRVGDNSIDCDYKDDEQQSVINDVCLKDRSTIFFQCISTKKCINQKKVGNGKCDCGLDQYGLCDDENPTLHYIRKHISFSNICDGFTDLLPVLIDGRNETDETECGLWPCDSIYTRCNGVWNCFDGADEIDCDPFPLINCSQQHVCISLYTNQLMCLPLEKTNDGKIDCLGAIDEPQLCRSHDHIHSQNNLHCRNRTSQPCISFDYLCFIENQFIDNDTTEVCDQNEKLTIYLSQGLEYCGLADFDIQNFFSRRRSDAHRLPPKYFTLDIMEKSTEFPPIEDRRPIIIQHSSFIQTSSEHKQRCHRGLLLRVWLDQGKRTTNTTCLCPPSFYGGICQYQNQRVSLTMKFQAYSNSRRTLFTILVSLIDNSDEQMIQSHQQFTFLFIRDCQVKFNVYLLYSTRSKNNLRNYSVRIDFYEKLSFNHRGSSLIPIKFPFLPVYRIATILNIPSVNENIDNCTHEQCRNGQCVRYSNDPTGPMFCHCYQGWSGRYCTIAHTCSCSNDSLCVGLLANNRSICICPTYKFGSRCLLDNPICQSNGNGTCYNGGECVPVDEHLAIKNKFFCICRKGFTGDRCEIPDTKMILSFDKAIALPQWMIVHFVRIMNDTLPESGTVFENIVIHQRTAIVNWPHRFHVAFIKLFNTTYYLIVVQKTYNASTTIIRTIKPSDRCEHISELLNKTIVEYSLLRRIKYYHLACQIQSPVLSCFYDDSHFCLCDYFDHRRVANCFAFDQRKKFDCFGYNRCQNGGECIQDRLTCPQTSMCICPTCFYGSQCQFTSDGFGLSLDGILGYHIQPHVSITHQSSLVQVSVALTIIMTAAGLVNNVLMIITFKNEEPRKIGCGRYLFCSSITNLLTTVVFALKFWMLLMTQTRHITNRSFLYSQCISIDFFLRMGLQIDQWWHACVAIERTITAIKGIQFDKVKSRRMAKYVILFLLVSIIVTCLHDPFHRRLINDDDDDEHKRIWCIAVYSSTFKTLNFYLNIFHSFTPFIINVVSAIIIIVITARRRTEVHINQSYRNIVLEQIREHRHLLVSSVALIILVLPRLIISLVSGCMKSMDNSALFLGGYLISFIPSVLTFAVFVLPSKSYKNAFWQSMKRYQSRMRRYLHRS